MILEAASLYPRRVHDSHSNLRSGHLLFLLTSEEQLMHFEAWQLVNLEAWQLMNLETWQLMNL